MHTVLFDIDGTLIASGGAGKAALEAALCAEFGIDRLIEKIELSGRTDRAIVIDMLRHHGLEESEQTHRRLLVAYLDQLPQALKRSTGRILPGIGVLLETLAKRDDVAVGLLTGNIRAGARIKLEHFGLFGFFAFGGYGDHHLDRDDVAREALAEAKARHNGTIRTDRVWVIGDTPLDIRCARAIGARVAAVTTGWHSRDELAEHSPDLLFDDLADPTALLNYLA